MSRRPGLSGDPETGSESIHTPGGMSDPGISGADTDAADVAATDMSAEPSSRQETTQPAFGEGRRESDELREVRDRHLRLAAEFDNYKKRVARERLELTDRAQATFVGRLLDVVDDLERIVARDPNTSADALRSAVEMLDRKLWKELESTGVERIDPTGQAFDPTQHEAVSVVPAPDPSRENSVAATFQTGYRFKGTLVRPARVQVFSARDQH